MICYLHHHHHHHHHHHASHGCRLLRAWLQRQLSQTRVVFNGDAQSRSGKNHNNINNLFLSRRISSSTSPILVSNNIIPTTTSTSTFACPHQQQQQQQQQQEKQPTSVDSNLVANQPTTRQNHSASWNKIRIFKQQITAKLLHLNESNSQKVIASLLLHPFTPGNPTRQIFPSINRYLSNTSDRVHHPNNNSRNNMKIAQIISGKEVADEIRSKLKERVTSLTVKPKLVIVQVGGREDSNVYIRMKIQFAESIGASAELIKLDRDVSEDELAKRIDQLNEDKTVHGIITQLPFDCSQKIDSDAIVNRIDPSKDVDGLSVYNAGKLSHGELNSSSFIPCTPNGCMELIRKSGIQIEGSKSVVIGRSKIVGSPMAQLLLWHNSTVTICHSKTKNIEELCKQADIVVAAVGRAQMVKSSWLKPGAVVIDCGINVIPDASKKSGTRLVGDVDFEDCKQVAGAITPVPGGVGPMTVAMLIANTVESASRVEAKLKH